MKLKKLNLFLNKLVLNHAGAMIELSLNEINFLRNNVKMKTSKKS